MATWLWTVGGMFRCFGPGVAAHHRRNANVFFSFFNARQTAAGGLPEEWPSQGLQPNMRLKLSARWRRVGRNAQWRPSILIAAPASRSLSAIR